MGSFYCLMAVVELGDYAADKQRQMRILIGSLGHLLIREIDFLGVCAGVWMSSVFKCVLCVHFDCQ